MSGRSSEADSLSVYGIWQSLAGKPEDGEDSQDGGKFDDGG